MPAYTYLLSVCLTLLMPVFVYPQKTLATLVKSESAPDCELLLDSLNTVPIVLKEAVLKKIAHCVTKNSVQEGRLARQYALFHFGAARYKDAIAWAQKEEKIYQTLGDKRKMLSARLISTQFYLSFDDGFRAHRIAKRVLSEAEAIKDTLMMASAYLSLGMSSRDFVARKNYFWEAIRYGNAVQNPNFATLGSVHNNLATAFDNANLMDSAQFHYQRALFYKEKAGYKNVNAFNTLSNLARIQIKRGCTQCALKLLDTAYAVARREKIDLGFYRIPLLLRQAECAIELHRTEMAQQAFHAVDSLIKIYPPYSLDSWTDYYLLHKQESYQQKNLSAYKYWDDRHTAFTDSMSRHRDSVFASNLEVFREIENAEAETEQFRQTSELRVVIIGALLLILLALWGWMHQRIRRKQISLDYMSQQQTVLQQQSALESMELQQLRMESELRDTQQKAVEAQLEYAHRQLAAHTVLMAKKSDFLREVSDQLKQLSKYSQVRQEEAIRKVLHALETEQGSNMEWEQFQKQFELVHPTFFQQLRLRFDKLTMHDIKLCAFIKMQLDNKDIARLMGIHSASVLTSRYRLRKKIHLSEQEDLDAFLIQL